MEAETPRLLIIGCASRDVIHLEPQSCTVNCLGGAGFYTALAAQVNGVSCTLLAPKPPEYDSVCAEHRINFEWIGPQASEDNFPHLEIKQHGNDCATLVNAGWGAESLLQLDALPADLRSFAIVHIAALSSASRQLDFLKAIRAQSSCKISVGTYARVAFGETSVVRELVSACDYAFMNENESNAIFDTAQFPLNPSVNQIFCVTRGRLGASIYTNDAELIVPGLPVHEYDPTGAGDTFAGPMLASLAKSHASGQRRNRSSSSRPSNNSAWSRVSHQLFRERERSARFKRLRAAMHLC
jgi:sugar/nucleoside kinase (ribokinase family)